MEVKSQPDILASVMIERYFVIISFDALGKSDLNVLKSLPGFSKLMQTASYSDHVYSVYPSLTYPCHTSISTGMFPMNHGVVSNTLLQMNRKNPDWNWERNKIKADTFYDAAMRNGLTTAAVLWPVTGKSKITYNLPEIFPNRPWQNQIMVSLMNGSPKYLLELNRKFGYLRKGIREPWLDNFVEASAHHTIKKKRPNVIMIHFVELDAMRHNFGYHSKEANQSLLSYDDKLFNMMKLLEDEGIMDKTTLFVLGDHDQIPVQKAIHLNAVFKAKGLIQTTKQKITGYDAYVKSEDGSAYVYLKNPKDTLMLEKVKTLLQALKERTDFGLEEIYSNEEAIEFGADRNCSFLLEAKRGFIFEDSHIKPALMELSEDKKKDGSFGKSAHGFSPFKEDYQTAFFAIGKGIKKNIHLESMRLIDEGPTFAHLMGTRLNETDGRILYEIIDNE